MKPLLSMSLRPLETGREQISSWISQSDAQIAHAASRFSTESIGETDYSLAVVGTVVLGICTAISIIWSIADDTFPTYGWISYAGLALCIAMTVRGVKRDRRRTRLMVSKDEELRTERATDPLYKRAKLLADAVACLDGHIARYGEQYDVFDQGLVQADESAADEYRLFIEGAIAKVLHGIDNFFKADAIAERQKKFRDEHGGVAESITSTALADLLAQLNEPVAVPKTDLLPNAHDILAFEGTLADTKEALERRPVPSPLVAVPAKA